MALIDDFKDRFPEFDPDEVDTYLPELINEYPCYFNCEYGQTDCGDAAILQLLAHMFVVETNPNTAPYKSTASKSVGSVSVSYNPGSSDYLSQYFNTTKYGQRFLLMTAKLGQGGYFV